MPELIDNTTRNRFEMIQDGQLTTLDYAREEGVMTLLTIAVPPALQGRGLAAGLLRAVLDRLRKQGLKVVPVCSYVQIFFRRHPDYADLLAGS